jgi:hypothetical protein
LAFNLLVMTFCTKELSFTPTNLIAANPSQAHLVSGKQ